jgi:hypothetical protein
MGRRAERHDMSTKPAIQFTCPVCSASHDRGCIDGVSLFRCLACGYQGHGHHPDPEIDREVEAERLAGNALNRAAGVGEVPPGVDARKGTTP